jgi:hypothetical protein
MLEIEKNHSLFVEQQGVSFGWYQKNLHGVPVIVSQMFYIIIRPIITVHFQNLPQSIYYFTFSK